MAAKDPEERVLAARIASAERWGRSGSREERAAATAPARAGLRARFEREADPEGTLTPGERAARADDLIRAHMLRMSLAAKSARRKAREAAARADTAERALADAAQAG